MSIIHIIFALASLMMSICEGEPSVLQIFVRNPVDGQFAIEMESKATIGDLRQKLASMARVPAESVTLSFAATAWHLHEDHIPLADTGIGNEAFLDFDIKRDPYVTVQWELFGLRSC